MGHLAFDQRKFLNRINVEGSRFHHTSNAYLTLRNIETSNNSGTIRKFVKMCYVSYVIEDQIRGRSGRPKDEQTNENIAGASFQIFLRGAIAPPPNLIL